jgi:hypothetical protein
MYKNLRCFKLRLNRKLYVKRHADKLNVGDLFLHREPVRNSAEVTHLYVPKCKTLDGESVKIVGDFDMAAILADFKIFR